jgi:hypothetical protein
VDWTGGSSAGDRGQPGVDVSQIRRQLRMTVPERVRSMVEVGNTLLAIQERARASRQRDE